MAITRAQQFKQMLQDGGRIGFKFGSKNRDKQKTSSSQQGSRRSKYDSSGDIKGGPSKPSTNFTDRDNIREQYGAQQTQTGIVKGGGLRRPDGSFDDKKVSGDEARESQAKFLLNTARGLSELKKRGVTQLPIGFPGSSVLNMLTPFRNFSLRKNIDYFRGLKSRNKNLGIRNYPETEQGYRDYMRDRLAGKIDAAGNLKAGFMRDGAGNIISRTRS